MAFDLVADQGLAARSASASSISATVKLEMPMWRASPSRLTLHKRAERFLKRNLRIGPVQQQQIDFAQAQPHQAVARRALERPRREMRRPDFGGHEQFAALDAGGANARPPLRVRCRTFRRCRHGGSQAATPARRRARRCGRANPRCRARPAEFWRRWPRLLGISIVPWNYRPSSLGATAQATGRRSISQSPTADRMASSRRLTSVRALRALAPPDDMTGLSAPCRAPRRRPRALVRAP